MSYNLEYLYNYSPQHKGLPVQKKDTMFRLHTLAGRSNKLLYDPLSSLSVLSRQNTVDDNLTSTVPSPTTTAAYALTDVDFSYSFQFWFLFSFHVPSIFCYIFVIIYIFVNKSQRKALHNHSVLCLLFFSFTIVIFDYSWTLDSSRRNGEVWLKSIAFCQFWWFLDFGFYDACTVVLAYASFERHILIFYSNFLSTRRRLIIFHYLPLIIMSIYLIVFYIYAIFFPPCESPYDFESPICGAYPCYLIVPLLASWALIFHGIVPIFLMLFFNAALLVRIIWHKRHHRQNWKKCRRMAFQLFSICALYLSMNFPLMLIAFVQSLGYPDFGTVVQVYVFFFCALIQYLLPFICLTYLPGIWKKFKNVYLRVTRRVAPAEAFTMTQIQRVHSKT